MLLTFLLKIALLVLTLLVVVPAFTGGAVAVRRGGFFRGLVSLFVVGLMNFILWLVFALATAGVALVGNFLTFGLVGVLINALAFLATARSMPEVLYVKDYGSAFWAALIMTVASGLIHMFVH